MVVRSRPGPGEVPCQNPPEGPGQPPPATNNELGHYPHRGNHCPNWGAIIAPKRAIIPPVGAAATPSRAMAAQVRAAVAQMGAIAALSSCNASERPRNGPISPGEGEPSSDASGVGAETTGPGSGTAASPRAPAGFAARAAPDSLGHPQPLAAYLHKRAGRLRFQSQEPPICAVVSTGPSAQTTFVDEIPSI